MQSISNLSEKDSDLDVRDELSVACMGGKIEDWALSTPMRMTPIVNVDTKDEAPMTYGDNEFVDLALV